MKMGKIRGGVREGEGWGRGFFLGGKGIFKKGSRLYFVHIPTSQEDCKPHVLQICTVPIKNRKKN